MSYQYTVKELCDGLAQEATEGRVGFFTHTYNEFRSRGHDVASRKRAEAHNLQNSQTFSKYVDAIKKQQQETIASAQREARRHMLKTRASQ